MNENWVAKSIVDTIIVETILPQCYAAIDTLIDSVGPANILKADLIKYRRLLPGGYKNSFEKSKT